ncbi:VOC family protein [Sphingomonas morindae]|uniref:VOC family protein n=1 Tax=Sphingomonas morindae TaxID=1541170 RepID=A0ABY4XD85_9SPHN|nr:VOC family protein [Sphingomonas morindae]USI74935.1 VOC family protein [Sphingomonas morindae]
MAVLGVGGFLFRATDPEGLKAWYATHLGVGAGCVGDPALAPDPHCWQAGAGPLMFAPLARDTDMLPADKGFMLNFRVSDLAALRARLGAAGIAVETRDEWDALGVGRFARLHDPEGNPIELWEPPAEA